MKWCKTRHRVIQYLLRPLFKLYFRLRYGVKTKYNKLYPEGALILSNHVTVMDMFYVGMSYKTPIYYMASIDIFEHFLPLRQHIALPSTTLYNPATGCVLA